MAEPQEQQAAVDLALAGGAIADLKPFRCKGCREVLAATDGARLRPSGALELRLVTTLFCTHCGARTVWRPVAAGVPMAR